MGFHDEFMDLVLAKLTTKDLGKLQRPKPVRPHWHHGQKKYPDR